MLGRSRFRFATVLPIAAVLVTIPLDATAQPPDSTAQSEERFPGELFFWAQLAAPLGEFKDHVESGLGLGGGALLYLGDQRHAALRAEIGWIDYGSETVRRPLSPTIPFVDVEVKTTHSLLLGGVGPQIFLSSGPLRPYIFGTVGFSHFSTETSVKSDHGDEPFATTTNFDDTNLLLTVGGGLSVRLKGEEGDPFHLDVSVVYNHNGLAEYVTEGGLRELPKGGWVVDPVESDANLITLRVGISFEL